MNADKGIELDVVPKLAKKGAVGSGDKGEDDDFETDERENPLTIGVENRVSNSEEFCLLAEAKENGESEEEEEPEVGTVATQTRRERAGKCTNGT